MHDEPAPGPTEQSDDTLLLLFLCAHPGLTPRIGGRPDTARRRRSHHPRDRGRVHGARGDDGPADQQGQEDVAGQAVRRGGRHRGRPARPLPDLHGRSLRTGRPRRRGDPAGPAARGGEPRARGPRAARPDAAAPRPAAGPHRRGRPARAARRAGPHPLGPRRDRRGRGGPAGRAGRGPARPATSCRRRSPPCTTTPRRPPRPTGRRCSSGTTSCSRLPRGPGRGAQPGGGGRARPRTGGRSGRGRPARPRPRRAAPRAGGAGLPARARRRPAGGREALRRGRGGVDAAPPSATTSCAVRRSRAAAGRGGTAGPGRVATAGRLLSPWPSPSASPDCPTSASPPSSTP